MPHFRVDDALHSHPKAQRAGDAAMGMWARAGSFCMAYLTDGFVPEWWVKQQPNGTKKARELVASGLWHDGAQREGEKGYQFHEFVGPGRQDSRQQIEAEREKWRKKKQSQRAMSPGDSGGDNYRESPGDTPGESPQESPLRAGAPPRANTNPTPTLNGSHLGGESHVSDARDDEPPRRCPRHEDHDDPPPCGSCAEARRTNDRWNLTRQKLEQDHANTEAVDRRHQAAADRQHQIENCPLCDQDGYLSGATICHHNPHQTETNQRGLAAVHAALKGQPIEDPEPDNEPREPPSAPTDPDEPPY